MKIYVNNDLTLGDEMVYLKKSIWKDFSNPNIVLGTKIKVILPKREFDKVDVKIPKNFETVNFSYGERIQFEDLKTIVYVYNGQLKLSCMAEDVNVFQN